MSSEVILDSSALLALIYQEPGADIVAKEKSVAISTVNLTEVVTKLIENGLLETDIQDTLATLNLTIVPYDEEIAYEAGRLRTLTRKQGLSLGDRACLATALIRGVPVLTADRIWLQANVEVEIKCIR
ncbi:MAG: VapC toxin family PIN domain ribonuclease [Gammaproteobacteria bacterium]|nr:MAG: VapC toxin family PIN domain ribonuclease [Gammaproteobacteria bacterium]RKZ41190.1 MAG: VapC toxin family PIN domain ribonuclease [Gammaproteobacteria bacterium]RKZ73181.1 MAG: VapC toxin family PIN domain ribonuclease [Gammaproteobacteria bacterium]